jgi:hypothetical protein
MRTDDKFMDQISALKGDRPSDELYDRIMTVVPNLAQVHDAPVVKESWVEKFFGEWSYGLSIKFASLVILGIIGFCVGHLNGSNEHQENLFSQIVTGDIGWED